MNLKPWPLVYGIVSNPFGVSCIRIRPVVARRPLLLLRMRQAATAAQSFAVRHVDRRHGGATPEAVHGHCNFGFVGGLGDGQVSTCPSWTHAGGA